VAVGVIFKMIKFFKVFRLLSFILAINFSVDCFALQRASNYSNLSRERSSGFVAPNHDQSQPENRTLQRTKSFTHGVKGQGSDTLGADFYATKMSLNDIFRKLDEQIIAFEKKMVVYRREIKVLKRSTAAINRQLDGSAREYDSATRIQRVVRGNQGRKTVAETRRRENAAGTIRSHQARTLAKELKRDRDFQRADQQQQNPVIEITPPPKQYSDEERARAATRIQRGYRNYKERGIPEEINYEEKNDNREQEQRPGGFLNRMEKL
jgi:hypothetical protein